MTNLSRTRRFNAAKLLQSDLNAWMSCQHLSCIFNETCMGGPRGTCTRTDGWPACTEEGKERMKEARVKWQRSKTYGSETPQERITRRIEANLRKMDMMLKMQGL